MSNLREWWHELTGGHIEPPKSDRPPVPDKVREKSHELANLATRSQGVAHAAKKQSEVIERFARAIQE